MERYFNTEGKCRSDIHYMVNLDDRLQKIRRMYVDRGKYFAVNRGRQYGKTTTLQALAEYLRKDYTVLWMDFQNMSTSAFENEHVFAVNFTNYFADKLKMADKTIGSDEIRELLDKSEENLFSMNEMFILMKKYAPYMKKHGIHWCLLLTKWTVHRIIRYLWIFWRC